MIHIICITYSEYILIKLVNLINKLRMYNKYHINDFDWEQFGIGIYFIYFRDSQE